VSCSGWTRRIRFRRGIRAPARPGRPGCSSSARRQVDKLVGELQTAQTQPAGKPDAGEKIDPDWESRYGHAVAMCRYAVMSGPAPSVEPETWAGVPPQLRSEYQTDPDELRAAAMRERLARMNADDRPPVRRTERV
jgi:hypothetical protein